MSLVDRLLKGILKSNVLSSNLDDDEINCASEFKVRVMNNKSL